MACPHEVAYCSPSMPCISCLSDELSEQALWDLDLRVGLPELVEVAPPEEFLECQEFYQEDLRDGVTSYQE